MALATRDATVNWSGTLAGGDGELRTGALDSALPMDWAKRTEQAHGTTSPEELLAAAHASCYAMTLALLLGREGHKPERLDVHGTCTLDRQDGTPEYVVSGLRLEVEGHVDGLDAGAFEGLAQRANEECAITGALKAPVELSARLA
jgi:lipoyl-dependent peroxiredoxin